MTQREQRRAARARLAGILREARARVDAMPEVQQARRRRARRLALLGALLLLLLVFVRCDCAPKPTPAPEEPSAGVVDAGIKTPPPKQVKRAPARDRIASSERPGYDPGAQRSPAWLDDFRLQVAARSPRLALCFTGADRPGALRWNVALNPESGAVSDHVFQPVGLADLTAKQRECLQRALSNPGYHVTQAERQSLPSRVSLVIEF